MYALAAVPIQRNSRTKGAPSKQLQPLPIFSTAATIRPLRPSIASAMATSRAFGVAVGELARTACAISASLRCGRKAQAAINAAAVERLTPAQQWINKGAVWSHLRTKARSFSTWDLAGSVWPSSSTTISERTTTRCFSAAIPVGRRTGVPLSINVTRLRAPVARTVSGNFESGQTWMRDIEAGLLLLRHGPESGPSIDRIWNDGHSGSVVFDEWSA